MIPPDSIPPYTDEISDKERAGLRRIMVEDGLEEDLAARSVEIFAAAAPEVWLSISLWIGARDAAARARTAAG